MPPPLPGLMLAAMLAAAMSTLDSGMNSLSTVAVKDFYLKFFNAEATERQQVLLAQFVTVAIGLFATLVALAINASAQTLRESVMEAASVWGAFSVVLAPVFLLAVTTRRVNGRVIWIGTVAAWGFNAGMVTWYVASKRGLDGAISPNWIVVPACLTVLMLVAALGIGAARRRQRFGALIAAVFALAYCTATTLWFLSGKHHGGVLSFMWVTWPGELVFLVIGYGSLPFLSKPDERTHRGLTLHSAHEPADEPVP
jgi:uncharacterized sodium:solute symporter family permease YidK